METQGPKSSKACLELESYERLSPKTQSRKQTGVEAMACIQITVAMAVLGEMADATLLNRSQP